MNSASAPLPRGLRERSPGLDEWAILVAYRGSIVHGTYEPNTKPGSIDDKDVLAVCVPPRDHYLGLREYGSRGTVEFMDDPWDVVIYEARKVIRLLEKGNPNVLSMLWLDDRFYLNVKAAGRLLIENRDLFAARSTFFPFMGYARSQLVKMERGAHKGYMGDKRRALVEKHGYDTKNAAHLIRLLRLGIEFLREGELIVTRPDAAELLAIKHGEWSLDRVKSEADRLFIRAEDAYDRSTLPAKPDRAAINELCVAVVAEGLNKAEADAEALTPKPLRSALRKTEAAE